MRGSIYLVLDSVQNAHATRRQLVEKLNFPPTLGFTHGVVEPTTPMMSAIQGDLPPNIKLMTISNNYAQWNNGQLIFRFAHMYQVDEHATLSQPATFSLASIFSKAGLKVSAASETMLTANQPRKSWEAKKKVWVVDEVVDRGVSKNPQDRRTWLEESDASLTVTMNAMEVKTFLVTLAN